MDITVMDDNSSKKKKKKKKEEKARFHELKKQKALEKASKLQAHKANPTNSEKKKLRNEDAGDNASDFIDPPTPVGEKKRLSPQMAKHYSPSDVEMAWYEWWEIQGYSVADAKSHKPPFAMLLPPPNVTGALHLGHALAAAIQDEDQYQLEKKRKPLLKNKYFWNNKSFCDSLNNLQLSMGLDYLNARNKRGHRDLVYIVNRSIRVLPIRG